MNVILKPRKRRLQEPPHLVLTSLLCLLIQPTHPPIHPPIQPPHQNPQPLLPKLPCTLCPDLALDLVVHEREEEGVVPLEDDDQRGQDQREGPVGGEGGQGEVEEGEEVG